MKTTLIAAGLALAATSASAETLSVYAPDYFASEWGPGPAIKEAFQAECGCELEWVTGDVLPRILLEEGHHDAVTWAIEQGAVGGMPLTGFAFGCASNADAFVPSPNQFSYFQGGGFDVSYPSFMEVDVDGNVNVSKLGKKPYLTAGCGGFVDITAHAKKIVFSGYFEAGAQLELTDEGLRVASPGKFTKMVEAVEHVTFAGRRAGARGADVLYITERCVMRLGDKGLVAHEIMPGIEPERDIIAASEGRVSVAENATTMPLSLLRDEPMGLSL